MDLQDHANMGGGSTVSLWGAVEFPDTLLWTARALPKEEGPPFSDCFFFSILKIISNPKLQGDTLMCLSIIVIELRAKAA